jgi:hypothetical protein
MGSVSVTVIWGEHQDLLSISGKFCCTEPFVETSRGIFIINVFAEIQKIWTGLNLRKSITLA